MQTSLLPGSSTSFAPFLLLSFRATAYFLPDFFTSLDNGLTVSSTGVEVTPPALTVASVLVSSYSLAGKATYCVALRALYSLRAASSADTSKVLVCSAGDESLT